jgi:hypothetical protein
MSETGWHLHGILVGVVQLLTTVEVVQPDLLVVDTSVQVQLLRMTSASAEAVHAHQRTCPQKLLSDLAENWSWPCHVDPAVAGAPVPNAAASVYAAVPVALVSPSVHAAEMTH